MATNPFAKFWCRGRCRERCGRAIRLGIEGVTVADYVGDAPRTGGLQREKQGQYQYHEQSLEEQERYHRQWQQEQSLSPSPAKIQDQPPPDVMSPYPNDPTFQSQPVSTSEDDQTTTLSQETRLKTAELKRLICRYSQYHRNPGAVVNCIVYYCNNGDNTLLEEKLEQLRTFDSMGYTGM